MESASMESPVTNAYLRNRPYYYGVDVLEKNVEHLNKKVLLYTQKLTAEFCIKYIFNPDIDSGSEDSYLFDKNHILEHQQHITEAEFDAAYEKVFYETTI